ncbi:MAG: M56 family peptidase [Deltaproteobacteria bacterium]|nr:MAG: M56 family peptidase [Deltaproteobacteria bacterium]
MSFLVLPAVALALFLVGAWATAAVAYPSFNAAVAARPGLARWSLLMSTLPVLVGATLALAAVLPGDPHLGSLASCHCHTSMPGWLHLCPVHPTTSPAVLGPAAVALLLLVPGRLRALAELYAEPLGTGRGTEPTLVDLPQPVAVLAGWLRPSLLVDRQLWSALAPTHREALLAHERAHLARRDPLVLASLRLLTAVAPGPLRQRLLRQWLDHAEHRADAGASASVDPLVLAEALVACARQGSPARLQLGWTAGRLENRVHALLALEHGQPARPDAHLTDIAAFALVAAGLASTVPWLHHQVEHLLNLPL